MSMGSLQDGSPSTKIDSDGQQDDTYTPKPVTATPENHADTSDIVKSAVDRTLHFLGNASNETLGACLVGLGATTYLVLGRVGLILIGAVGGVVLHATWESSDRGQGEDLQERENKRKRETNAEIALRLLQWREARRNRLSSDDKDNDEPFDQDSSTAPDYSNFEPEVGKALNVLTDAVIRDYVHWWYDPVRPDESIFPSTCRRTLTSFILALSSNLSRKRSADMFLEFVTNSSSIMIVVLNELSVALSASPSSTPSEAIQTYLKAKPQSNLANILDNQQQRRKLEMVANDILENYLDAKVFSCPPAKVFLKEALANVVLEMTIQSCSRSEWINEWIVYLLEDGEPELLNAIDAGVEESGAQHAIPNTHSTDANATNNPKSEAQTAADHKRNVSKAEEAMEDAMREAQRLTQLIAEEDAKRARESGGPTFDDASDSTNTHGIQTPASSQSDPHPDEAHVSTPGTSNDTSSPVDAMESSSLPASNPSTLTSLDQRVSVETSTSLDVQPVETAEVLTLHKASIAIFDDAAPNDKRALKSKPTIDYMVQIEPSSSSFRGWMIARTYADFETLHEVLRRISTISGAVTFSDAHSQLPAWRGATKAQLTSELERYLTDAVQFEPLAESEGMKRFLEKSRGVSKSPVSKNVFWTGSQAIENVGKGMFDVLSKAPKGMAGGGKAVLGGVTSVLGGGQNTKKTGQNATTSGPAVTSNPNLARSSASLENQEQNNPAQASLGTSSQPASPRSSTSTREPVAQAAEPIPSRPETPQMDLPPPPSEIPDDYKSPSKSFEPFQPSPQPAASPSAENTPVLGASFPTTEVTQEPPAPPQHPRNARNNKKKAPMSEQEAQVTVELLFAVINELYTLSSAWNIRRTLLNAAKAYLLRPGNPQLENIRVLLQESVLDANTSDSGMAMHILKVRENTLPTEEELKKWPPLPTEEEKEALRKRARKMLVERGMPQALTSVMGVAASGEALGRVFDCLQINQVARGLVFGMMLQAVRAVTQ